MYFISFCLGAMFYRLFIGVKNINAKREGYLDALKAVELPLKSTKFKIVQRVQDLLHKPLKPFYVSFTVYPGEQ